jgi:outer membrane protein OmpA-like peptidoglycan-associated protein
MKKGLIAGILILVILIAAGGSAFFLYKKEALVIRNPLLVQETPVITYLSGEVYYADEQSEDWAEPEAGQKLKQGTILKTGIDGEMDIRLSSETLLRLDNNSVMILEKSTLKNVNLTLTEGRLYGRFHKLFNSQDINVKTETAVAGIRGTDLVFESKEGESVVYALSGITEVYNPEQPNEKLLLSFQRKTVVKGKEAPSLPQQMSNEEIQEFQTVLNAIHKDTVLLVTRAIRFKPDSSEILDSSIPELERLKAQILDTKYTVMIIGHTADLGYAASQLKLSILRAQAIKDYLVAQGISKKRLKVEGFGGTKPIADNSTEEGKALNRRVEFLIIE